MSNFILFSGILLLVILTLLIALKLVGKKHHWHKYLGYAVYFLALGHGAVALYKMLRIYFIYS